jgi:nucleotide-binding universal stress UspA family protein
MKRILVPTDFSDYSKIALQFAANLAHKINGRIYLIHVFDDNGVDMPGTTGSGSWMGAMSGNEIPLMIDRLRSIKSQIQNFIKNCGVPNTDIYHNVESGVPHMKINYAAEKYHCDMIVMGTHGATGFQEMFIGTTTEKVVHYANRPVLSIKENVNLNPSNIVFATDFSEEADEVFDSVKGFAEIFNANIHLLNVNVNDVNRDQIAGRIEQFREQHEVTYMPYTIYNDKKTEAGILHFAKRMCADMIAIGTHGRHGLARFFNPSISEELVNHSFCPVLTINFGKK